MTGKAAPPAARQEPDDDVSTREYLGRRIGADEIRLVAGPTGFFILALGLLTYDHIRGELSGFAFWLGVALIVAIFVWLVIRGGRSAAEAAAERRRSHLDRLTGLWNGDALLEKLEARCADQAPSTLLVFEVEHDSGASPETLDPTAARLAGELRAVTAELDGDVYRTGGLRFALLVARGEIPTDELVTQVRAVLDWDEHGSAVSAHHGECEIPEEANQAGAALDLAARRMAARERLGRRSSRRQAHAALVAALSTRRPHLREHLRAVVPLTISVGRRLGLEGEELDDVVLAAGLQDIGMLGVPEAVLEKPGRLSDSERATIQQHPVAGEGIVGSAVSLAPVARLVRSAYEHFDGSGYPDGLTGEDIPLGSRIISACVASAAMMAPRPHRAALGIDGAIAELRACAGRQFDPRVVEVLVEELSGRTGLEQTPR